MGRIVALTFDVEQDCPPFAETKNGMRYGLPKVMDLLEGYGIKGTFLFTGRMAEEFPELARRAAKKHELGCHGLEHERFDRLSMDEVRKRLLEARGILTRFGEIISFRAPNFQFPDEYYPLLAQLGFKVDSTKARHKGWKKGVVQIGGITEVPATTSIVTRLPWRLQERFHRKFESPVV
ncbi:polysaccharide deacetylase family protein [Thermococcus sp. Bubb.Bath]|uniref:polysaccharide deacetylase family protein n=1 Tax=Thermococcus sp. Bubb.Bath TaxID=1638242 RepID=UPI001F0FEA6C|nr:polysaccharide deacetylase family protein [Thermococcus sp. Bubb.Bath]